DPLGERALLHDLLDLCQVTGVGASHDGVCALQQLPQHSADGRPRAICDPGEMRGAYHRPAAVAHACLEVGNECVRGRYDDAAGKNLVRQLTQGGTGEYSDRHVHTYALLCVEHAYFE